MAYFSMKINCFNTLKLSIFFGGFLLSVLLANLLIPNTAFASEKSPDGIWEKIINKQQLQLRQAAKGVSSISNIPNAIELVTNLDILKQTLQNAPSINARYFGQSGPTIFLPIAEGSFTSFVVYETQTLSAKLAEKFPNIKTYKAFGVEKPELHAVLDITPRGFHAMIVGGEKVFYIDPDIEDFKQQKLLNKNIFNAPNHYRAFHAEKFSDFSCSIHQQNDYLPKTENITQLAKQNGSSLTTYKIAVSTSSEYADAVSIGATNKTDTQSAIATAISRVNGIYNTGLAIHLQLVDNNEDLIFTNQLTDPYTNDADNDIDKVTDVIDQIIGNSNYDIGHLFTVNGGGLAGLGSVCSPSRKGQGVTGVFADQLESDAFYIDYVAHEIGHQFGANHTFNGTSGFCGSGNRNAATAFEPGSGSTIMAYAGICDDENLQNSSDPYFHAGSIQEILTFTEADGNCGFQTVISNSPPTVSAEISFNIPANTPFKLTADGNDSEGDIVTYTWEQMDTGFSTSTISEVGTDNGNRTLFRSFPGSTNPTRFFPSFDDVLDQTLSFGEAYPNTNRSLTFRVTARSGLYGLANNDETDTTVNVTKTSSSFNIIKPALNSYHLEATPSLITWNTASTNLSPINCSEVDILFADDGGLNFSSFSSLLNNTPNDGSQNVPLPSGTTSTGRILIQCSDNIFYNINKGNINIVDNSFSLFTINPTTQTITEGSLGEQTLKFTVSRIGNLNTSSSVNVNLQGFGSFPADSNDYANDQTFASTMTFANTESEKLFTVKLKGDFEFENDEQFEVTLSNPTNAFLTSASESIVTISNDDNLKLKSSSKGNLSYLSIFLMYLALFFKKKSFIIKYKKYLALSLTLFLSGLLFNCSQISQENIQQTTQHSQDIKQSAIHSQNEDIHPQVLALQWLQTASAQKDFENAIKRNNDLQFLASGPKGYISLPGLNNEKYILAIKHGYKIQEGMGDLIINEEHSKLRQKFKVYAEEYNQLLAEHLF
jgi:hypothetical protein